MSTLPQQDITYMQREDISRSFQRAGWVRGAGGDLYYDGHLGHHPHLHIKLDSKAKVRMGRDIRLAVSMLAWSNGGQGNGGGGITFISNGTVLKHQWEGFIDSLHMNQAMGAEFRWLMTYFTEG